MKRLFFLVAVLITAFSAAHAQNYTIYPIPQSMEMKGDMLTLTKRVNIIADKDIDITTVDRAKSILAANGREIMLDKKENAAMTTLYLRIKPATTFANAGKYDRHSLVIDSKSITITGEHTNAVFFGLASLEQILEQPSSDGKYLGVVINDFADQKSRGVIEGFYGFPYSVSVKKDLMSFMMRYKMNTYMYGGKSDPYHSRYWKDAYPAKITDKQEKEGWLSQDMIRDITRRSEETKVDFIWAIHPGNDFLRSKTAVKDIMGKFEKMHQLGVRHFAVFVDDVAIPSKVSDMTLTANRVIELQRAIEKKWNKRSAAARDTVRPLHFVPQIYCSDFASSVEQRQNFMREIGKTPSHITVYTTGQAVWSVPSSEHTANMNRELGRDMAWWWNYPCNDNADAYIYPSDMYTNFVDLPAVRDDARMPKDLSHCVGLVSNPMQQGEVSKTALFSVADYAWNNSEFDNQKSWAASFPAIIKDQKIREAYKALTPFLRWNEPNTLVKEMWNFKNSANAAEPKSKGLKTQLQSIYDDIMQVKKLQNSSYESDRLLYMDLAPWLSKLQADIDTALALIDVIESKGNPADAKAKYEAAKAKVRDLETNPDYRVTALEGMGEHITSRTYITQASTNHLDDFVDYLFRKAYTVQK